MEGTEMKHNGKWQCPKCIGKGYIVKAMDSGCNMCQGSGRLSRKKVIHRLKNHILDFANGESGDKSPWIYYWHTKRLIRLLSNKHLVWKTEVNNTKPQGEKSGLEHARNLVMDILAENNMAEIKKEGVRIE